MAERANREDLHRQIRALLERTPKISAAAAHRELGCPLHYVTFQTGHFKPVKEEFERERIAAAATRQSRIPLTPPVAQLKLEAVERLRSERTELAESDGMRSTRGLYHGKDLGGGDFQVVIDIRAVVPRYVHVFLTGFLHGILFPEVGQ